MKKIIALGMVLFIIIAGSCGEKKEVTLESMKEALTEAGYEIFADGDSHADGFWFIYPGSHGDYYVPVWEFESKEETNSYAADVNADKNYAAVIKGNFLAVCEAHNGVPHTSEKAFLEDLLSGKSIK
jgi:hypothetical protein